MKFAATLIKIFSGVLSAFAFGIFVYYTYQYQLSQETSNLLIANISLIIFLITSVTFALLFITFDAYQNKGLSDLLLKTLNNSVLGSTANSSEGTASTTDILARISAANERTNLILENRFQILGDVIGKLNENNGNGNQNLQAVMEQLTALCEQISNNVDTIKNGNSEEFQRNVTQSGNFAVLVSTVSRLSSDINDLNGRLLDVVNQISRNVTSSIKSHTDIDNEIKELLQKILTAKAENMQITDEQSDNLPVITPENEETLTPVISESSSHETENDEPEAQSVADFYEKHFNTLNEKQAKEDVETPEEINEDTDIQQENENRIDDLISTPLQEETFIPQSVDLTEPQSEIVLEDNVADEAVKKEENEPWESSLAEQINDTENEYLTKEFDSVPPTSEVQEVATMPTENAIGNDVASENIPDTPAEIDSSSDKLPIQSTSIVADDPFNPPAHYFTEEKNKTENKDGETPYFETSPTTDNQETSIEPKLDSVFNDDLASTLADLDILKDDKDSSQPKELSVDDLLADEKDPLNPNL